MDKPWISDEKGNKMEIPRELYSEIRKMIRNHEKISFHLVSQKDIDEFFQNNFSSKDKRKK